MDNQAVAAMWTDDGADLLPGLPPMKGKQAITDWLNNITNQLKDTKVTQCDVEWKSIQVVGDVAYEWGLNSQTVTSAGKDPQRNFGKITLVLRKQKDGSWKIALESWNSSPPLS